MSKNSRIVFMGTPTFAVASLGSLLMNGFNLVGVVTVPDKPSGRGQKITRSDVGQFSDLSSLPVLQPPDLRDTGFIADLKKMKPDIIVVVAFRMLPFEVWSIPSLGTINLHASLLPQYRGAAPINHAIINGENITGVTTFLIDRNIDTGNILFQEEVPIFPFEDAGSLHDRLMRTGARLVVHTVKSMIDGTAIPKPQSDFISMSEVIRPAPKLFPQNCAINWTLEATMLHNFIRGLSPYPGARTEFIGNGEKISFKIFESHPEVEKHMLEPGMVKTDGRHFLKIACKDGFINILSIQLAGRSRVTAIEFLRGFNTTKYRAAIPEL
jgi:methionyl-tRNA formyltransferase